LRHYSRLSSPALLRAQCWQDDAGMTTGKCGAAAKVRGILI
jgi:hypothetical protein